MIFDDIVVGNDVEYGLFIEGRGAAFQVSDSSDFVNSYPGPAFLGWDYRGEHPRRDLRGFEVDKLAIDPTDAQFDEESARNPRADDRADHILPNGARFYSDHGHPEYATPECRSIRELAAHDWAGVQVVMRTARAYEAQTGRRTKIYRNNTDYHGASYGTHESYLVPRKIPLEALVKGLLPLMVCRPLLVGAGKVGSEINRKGTFQLSQRADFLSEIINVETLHRRPLFNTRDEPHGQESAWIRLHVICGDVNMKHSLTALKAGLMKLGICLVAIGKAPQFILENPVEAHREISYSLGKTAVPLSGGGSETCESILRAYLDAAGEHLQPDPELQFTLDTARSILKALKEEDQDALAALTDWGAKMSIFRQLDTSDVDHMKSVDLAYSDCDREEGLYYALEEHDPVWDKWVEKCVSTPPDDTRAKVRGIATGFEELVTANWKSVTIRTTQGVQTIELDPAGKFTQELHSGLDVLEFIERIKT